MNQELIGSAISSGSRALGGIVRGITGMIMARKARKAQQKAMDEVNANLRKQQQENETWYNRRYNEDDTQRADTVRLLTMTEDSIRNRNQQAEATKAVMGGTDASVAATKEANNKALSDTMSQIAAQASARKDMIEGEYMDKKTSLYGQQNDMSLKKGQMDADYYKSRGMAVDKALQGVEDSGVEVGRGASEAGGFGKLFGK